LPLCPDALCSCSRPIANLSARATDSLSSGVRSSRAASLRIPERCCSSLSLAAHSIFSSSLNCAANLRKDVVCVRANQVDCAHQNDEDYGEHDRVFCNSLALFRSQFIQVETPQASCFKKSLGSMFTFSLHRQEWPNSGNPKVIPPVLQP
jgi:hypothetical protein